MNLERRQVALLVGGLVLVALIVYVLIPRSGPVPGSSAGPSVSGSPGVSSGAPTASASGPGASGTASTSPDGSPASPSAVTPTPGVTEAPGALSGTWSGTWVNVTPDQATGTFEVELVQLGSALSGTITMEGSSCFTGGGIQGTVEGDAVAFQVLQRDELEFDGTVAGTRMTGLFDRSCDSSSGTWELTKSGG